MVFCGYVVMRRRSNNEDVKTERILVSILVYLKFRFLTTFNRKGAEINKTFRIFAPASTDTGISCWRYMKYNRPLDMNALDNANIKDENCSGFVSFAFPEAKSSKTGVSVRYVACEDKAWYVLRITIKGLQSGLTTAYIPPYCLEKIENEESV